MKEQKPLEILLVEDQPEHIEDAKQIFEKCQEAGADIKVD